MFTDPILSYHQTSFHQPRAIEILNEYPWRGDEHILDIGCGDGRITAELAKRVPQGYILGIDLSLRTIEFAKSAFPNNQYPNLEFCCLDFMNSDYEEQFDVVVSVAAMHYVPDQFQVLKRVENSIKFNGQALLFLVGIKTDPIWKAMTVLLSTPKWRHLSPLMSYGLCTQEEYFLFFKKIGLNIINFQIEEISSFHKKKLEVKQDFLGNFLSVTNRIPKSQCDEFINDFLEVALLYFLPDQNQTIKIWETFLYFRAAKI